MNLPLDVKLQYNQSTLINTAHDKQFAITTVADNKPFFFDDRKKIYIISYLENK